ncbi:aminoglycoside phosphotransferase family protein [Kitasatospora sp. GP82]|uniref:phosphotransferase family protein n=1 Tax=Kitasatospora sp. GP82 TaxID=3035089 RepID=UPI0024732EC5|nr:aminoglycoside phosphotransferase family protein [Kitasatospora sp. GP82]MDH6125434.1 tRNA A-37 threonylcarbamoyl transferase component Bud32 [Kitasatospora sp. GP82]
MRSRVPFGERLRADLGSPGQVRRLGSSPRSRVWQVELSGTPVVLKQLVDAPEAAERYAREVAALRLASRVEPPVVPRLLGTDPDERVLVLEHLEHRRPAEDWVVEYAAALARLHAATSGDADADEMSVLPAWSGPTQDDVDSFLALARTLEVAAPPRVGAELDDLVNRLTAAPGRALLHGDPCPGNDLHTGGGIRFIDFEQAALGSGVVELAYLRIGFPTCWCVTAPPRPLLDAAEAAYRTAWRDATGTDVRGDLADACAGWLLRGDALVERARRATADHLAAVPHRDWAWGTATARQRLLHRLDVVSRSTAERPGLTALGQLATAVHSRMLTRWPTLQPLPAERP